MRNLRPKTHYTIFLKTPETSREAQPTPVLACCKTGLSGLNLLDQEKLGADREEAIKQSVDSLVTLSGGDIETMKEKTEELVKEIRKGLGMVSLIVDIRPVNISEIEDYRTSMAKIMQPA